MGLFDRFRSGGQLVANVSASRAETSEQDATRLIDAGHELQAQGNLDAAMQCYLDAIRLAPNPARAHLNRGNVLLLKGDLEGALQAFSTAIQHKPDYAGAYYNIGNALLGNGQFDEAAANYRSALEIQPDYAEVHCSLGVALKELGKIDEAIASLQRALKFNPGLIEAHTNLEGVMRDIFSMGNVLMGNGQLNEALANYRLVLKIKPDYAEAHCNKGLALQAIGQLDDAMTCYLRALEINPGFAEAHLHLGNGLQRLRHFDSAAECYHRALEIKPDFAEAHINLGNTLQALGQLQSAAECYHRALETKPDFAEAHINLGDILQALGQPEGAAENYRLALKIQPDNAMFRVKQAFSLPTAPQTITASLAVPAELDHALQKLSVWLLSSPACQESFSEVAGSKQPFYLAYRNGNHVALLSRYGNLVAANPIEIPITSVPKRKKIRLVIVSNHFYRHSVWDVILRGVLANLDRVRFEIILYNTDRSEDEETKIAKTLCDIWRDFQTISSLDGWLDAIATDQPDAIFYPEIGMDPMTFRLASRRLAPLQMASWGHPITTGLPTIDLYFSGEMLEAPDADTHYREWLVRLPGTGCCTTPIPLIPEPLPDLAAELAKRRGTCFVIAQMVFKFDPADDALFASIAAAVGECTFILLKKPKYSFATDQLISRLNQTFYDRDLDPKQHLLVIPWQSREKFYGLLDLCDIYLDCPSFSGYTTAWQAIQRGLPVVTLEGKFMRQRLAAGLLRKIGITDTIAASKEDYIAIAARLAAECRDRNHRDSRRNAIKAAAPLADNDISVVRAFEQSIIKWLADQGRSFEFDCKLKQEKPT